MSGPRVAPRRLSDSPNELLTPLGRPRQCPGPVLFHGVADGRPIGSTRPCQPEAALFVTEAALFPREAALFVTEAALFATEAALFAAESLSRFVFAKKFAVRHSRTFFQQPKSFHKQFGAIRKCSGRLRCSQPSCAVRADDLKVGAATCGITTGPIWLQ